MNKIEEPIEESLKKEESGEGRVIDKLKVLEPTLRHEESRSVALL